MLGFKCRWKECWSIKLGVSTAAAWVLTSCSCKDQYIISKRKRQQTSTVAHFEPWALETKFCSQNRSCTRPFAEQWNFIAINKQKRHKEQLLEKLLCKVSLERIKPEIQSWLSCAKAEIIIHARMLDPINKIREVRRSKQLYQRLRASVRSWGQSEVEFVSQPEEQVLCHQSAKRRGKVLRLLVLQRHQVVEEGIGKQEASSGKQAHPIDDQNQR